MPQFQPRQWFCHFYQNYWKHDFALKGQCKPWLILATLNIFFSSWLVFVGFQYSIAMTVVIYPIAGCLVFQDSKNALRQLHGITNMKYLIIVIFLMCLLYFMIISIFWCGVNTILIVGGRGRCCMDKSNAFVSHDIRESAGAAEISGRQHKSYNILI